MATKKRTAKKTTTKEAQPSKKGKPTWISEAKHDGNELLAYSLGLYQEIQTLSERLLQLSTSDLPANLLKQRLVKDYSTIQLRLFRMQPPVSKHFTLNTPARETGMTNPQVN